MYTPIVNFVSVVSRATYFHIVARVDPLENRATSTISPRSSSIAINIPLAPLSLPYLTIRIIVLTMPKDKSQLITWIHVRTGYIISCEEFVLLMFAIRD